MYFGSSFAIFVFFFVFFDKIILFKFPSPTANIIFCANGDYIHKAGFVSDVSDSRAKARTLATSYAK